MTNDSVSVIREHVDNFIREAIDAGKSPRDIRRHLQDCGVSWRYSVRTQGDRERYRRLRQHSLCITGCGNYADWQHHPGCFDCRAKVWK